MRKTKDRLFLALAFASTAEQLKVIFVDHANARGADRATEALQTSIDLARDRAIGIEAAIQNILPPLTFLRDQAIFARHEPGHPQAVVDFLQTDSIGRSMCRDRGSKYV